jgi:cytochrome c oxidase cbb3-type subunit 3
VAESKKYDPIQGEIIHEYDGIQEADNRLPLWWLWTLYAAIAFSVVYWFYYEEFAVAPGPQQAYYAEQAREQEKAGGDPTGEQLLAQLNTPAVEAGQKVFLANCVSCHESQGQGKIGPNLTDAAWLHGSDPVQIWKTIKDGVPAKGMPPWGPALGRLGVTQAAAFVLSIRGTNVKGKAPEGTVEDAAPPLAPVPAPATEAQDTPPTAGVQQVSAAAVEP